MSRVPYIIGDIHGCMSELTALEALIDGHAAQQGWQPLFVSVGDLVDRGPDSRKVVAHFRAGVAAKSHVVVMGNHEAEFLRQLHCYLGSELAVQLPPYLFSLEEDFALARRGSSLFPDAASYRAMMTQMWVSQGGRETLASYGLDAEDPAQWHVDTADIEFLTRLPVLWYNDDLVVTHALAGPEPVEALAVFTAKKRRRRRAEDAGRVAKEAAFTALWNRITPDQRIDARRWHVSGHTPLDEVEEAGEQAFIQIDTGCVYGRRLTAYCHKTRSYLSVESQTSWARE